jgi:hypothetical protein
MEAGHEGLRDHGERNARRRAEGLADAADFSLEGRDRGRTVDALTSLLLLADDLAALPLEGVEPALRNIRRQ